MAFRLNCAFCGKCFNGTNDDFLKIVLGWTSSNRIVKEGNICGDCQTKKTIPKLLKRED